MESSFDVIVVGLGAMGAATTYQLAKSGARVLGLDRFDPPHTLGSSHGETRITRLACGEGPEYTAFARRSHAIWRDLERTSGESLLVQNGLLVISGPGERSAAHGKSHFLQATIDAAAANGVAHETLSAPDMRARFPAFGTADGETGYFESEAGFLFPERCVAVQLQQARAHGATLHANETMRRYDANADGVRVVTDRGESTAARLVLAAGPWLPGLLARERQRLFAVRRQVLLWFAMKPGAPRDHVMPARFPVFYWQGPRRQAIYGFPSIDGGETIKIATEQYETETTPDAIDRTVSPQEIGATYAEYVAPFFPLVGGECVRSAVCLYTCTEDTRFIVDTLPEQQNVLVASPCSGHGFKHSAALGEAIAAWLTNGRPSLDLSPFRLKA
jgi:sarcosine oxidase